MNEWRAKRVARFLAFEEDMDDRELYAALFSDTLAPVEQQRIWTPAEYIREEVRRQGHNLNDPMDGGRRVEWMTHAWNWAKERAKIATRPIVQDVINIGVMVEPEKNAGGLRHVNVRIGSRLCMPPDLVPRALENLCASGLLPLEWYLEYELIHPFVDGNGRSGKILLQWLNGKSFNSPIFPPADIFGHPIANP